MIKSELTRLIATKMNHLPEHIVADAVNLITRCLADTLAKGQRIEIRDFASFAIREAKPRIARNPRTGDSVQTIAKPKVHFRAGIALRKGVQASRDIVAIVKPITLTKEEPHE